MSGTRQADSEGGQIVPGCTEMRWETSEGKLAAPQSADGWVGVDLLPGGGGGGGGN